jgi:hypothetical protein
MKKNDSNHSNDQQTEIEKDFLDSGPSSNANAEHAANGSIADTEPSNSGVGSEGAKQGNRATNSDVEESQSEADENEAKTSEQGKGGDSWSEITDQSAEPEDGEAFPRPDVRKDDATLDHTIEQHAIEDLSVDSTSSLSFTSAEGDWNGDERDKFSQPASVSGELSIPLYKLTPWDRHICSRSRTRGDAMAGILASAANPEMLSPIEVLAEAGGQYRVKDGRRRYLALCEQHGKDGHVEIRCTIYSGTEVEAVEEVCDQAVGSVIRTPIERALAILNVQCFAGVSQKAICERFPALNKDQVSRMTIAAKAFEEFPDVFDLLAEPDRVSIDVCVRLAQHMKAASDEGCGAVLVRAESLSEEGASLKNNELFEALGIETADNLQARAKMDPLEPVHSDPIFGADDQPVGAIELLGDDVTRLRLPDPATMSPAEREEAANAFIKQIRRYFDLDPAG